MPRKRLVEDTEGRIGNIISFEPEGVLVQFGTNQGSNGAKRKYEAVYEFLAEGTYTRLTPTRTNRNRCVHGRRYPCKGIDCLKGT